MTNLISADTAAASQHLADLERLGFCRLPPEALDPTKVADHHVLQGAFDSEQEADSTGGRRWRSHSKLAMVDGSLRLLPHTTYVQSATYNPDHGDIHRGFRPIANSVLRSDTLQHIIRFTEVIARDTVPDVFSRPEVVVGLHMVSYRPVQGAPSYSSPVWLHRDEEPFVAVVLCGITCNLGGGENVVSIGGAGKVYDAFKMTERLEMLLLTKKYWHAVTPMYSTDGRPARRDILLVTFS